MPEEGRRKDIHGRTPLLTVRYLVDRVGCVWGGWEGVGLSCAIGVLAGFAAICPFLGIRGARYEVTIYLPRNRRLGVSRRLRYLDWRRGFGFCLSGGLAVFQIGMLSIRGMVILRRNIWFVNDHTSAPEWSLAKRVASHEFRYPAQVLVGVRYLFSHRHNGLRSNQVT